MFIETAEAKKHPDLSPTCSAVLQLAQTLPYSAYQFSLFCDNLFSNPMLFSLLRQLGIGACGTARRNVTKLVFGNLDSWKVAWGTLHSKIVNVYPENLRNGKVLVSVWQDSNKVGFCSTIHDGTEWIIKARKCPRGSSTSASITRQPFLKFPLDLFPGCKQLHEFTRLLPIPCQTNDYNQFMGGVDISDQLRTKFSSQLRGVKTWRPLFYWLLDTTIVNAYLVYEHQRKAKLQLGEKDKARCTHRMFCEALVTALLKDPQEPKPTCPGQYITKRTQLPLIRLTRPIGIHQMESTTKRVPCLFCRWSRHKKQPTTGGITKSENLPKTRTLCSHCSVALCSSCFYLFHYAVD